MKYMLNKIDSSVGEFVSIVIDSGEGFTSFPAEVGNPNYDAFLEQAKLTDKQVQALTPDTWYDFPKETK